MQLSKKYKRKNNCLSPEDKESFDRLNKIWGFKVSDIDINKEVQEISEETVVFKEAFNYNDSYLRKSQIQKYGSRKHKSKITKVRNY